MKGTQVLLLCTALCSPATGFILQEMTGCSFGDTKGGNTTFSYQLTFNRLPLVEYDDSAKMFYPISREYAFITTYFNSDPNMVEEMEEEKKRCNENVKEFWLSTVERSVSPSMVMYLSEMLHNDRAQILVCHIWGFYPQDIKVLWVKNEKTILGNYTKADTVGDWTYRIRVLLDVTDAQPNDIYECVVQHSSLKDLMIKTWKCGLNSTQIIKISISTAIFALGLLIFVTGLICWSMAKKDGYTPMTRYNEGD